MASIQKTANGYRVQVSVRGQRDSETFKTKRQAQDWGAQREIELREAAASGPRSSKTLRDVLRQYAEEVSPTRRGESKEVLRLRAFEKLEHGLPISKRIGDVTDDDLRAWRDRRMAVRASGSVLRDMTLMRSVLEQARTEWKYIRHNPMADLKKPPTPPHRKRVITGLETRKVLRALGFSRKPARSVSQAVAVAFLLALSTGMRAGEICGLRWADVRTDYGTAHNVKSVHLGVSRDIPMSAVAKRLLERMRGWDDDLVFGLSAGTLDALFRRARHRAGLEGFTFHDARRTAATRLCKALDVLTLCKMFGWTNPQMAMVYYAPTPESIAALINGAKRPSN